MGVTVTQEHNQTAVIELLFKLLDYSYQPLAVIDSDAA